MADRKEQLQKVAQKKYDELGAPVIVTAYLTHIIDLQTQLIKDLAGAVDQTKLSTAAQDRLALLDQVAAATSIDFANITSPLENYKIPGAVQIKEKSNVLMKEYIEALAREGLLS